MKTQELLDCAFIGVCAVTMVIVVCCGTQQNHHISLQYQVLSDENKGHLNP